MQTSEVRVGGMNWFLPPGESGYVQIRYNSPPVACEVEEAVDGEWLARTAEPVFGVAPGQSAVFYTPDGERVVGGGVVSPRK